MTQFSECKWCFDTCRDYIQKYSYIIGIQPEMLKSSFFRALGVIKHFISSVFSSLWLSIQHFCKSDHKVSRQEPRIQGENKAREKFGLSDRLCVKKVFSDWEDRQNSSTWHSLHNESNLLFLLSNALFFPCLLFSANQVSILRLQSPENPQCLSFLLQLEKTGMHPCSSKLQIYKRIT